MSSGQRVLREYQAIAQTYHFCDHCFHQISPGDIYEGSVMVISGKLFVLKHHIHPDCPPSDFDDWCEEDSEENELEASVGQADPFSQAA